MGSVLLDGRAIYLHCTHPILLYCYGGVVVEEGGRERRKVGRREGASVCVCVCVCVYCMYCINPLGMYTGKCLQ